MLVFDRVEEGKDSADYLCYKEVVAAKDWLRECPFLKSNESSVTVLVNQQLFEMNIKSALLDSNTLDRQIIIDNTPYPPHGVMPTSAFTLLMQTRSEFNNTLSVKTVVILEGMVCLVLLFASGVFLYLCMKMKSGSQKMLRSKGKKEKRISVGAEKLD